MSEFLEHLLLQRRVQPERNSNVKLEEKVEAPAFPLESSVRDFGDPNPCCAQLFNPEPERKWVCGGVGAERGKLRSVIVA